HVVLLDEVAVGAVDGVEGLVAGERDVGGPGRAGAGGSAQPGARWLARLGGTCRAVGERQRQRDRGGGHDRGAADDGRAGRRDGPAPWDAKLHTVTLPLVVAAACPPRTGLVPG